MINKIKFGGLIAYIIVGIFTVLFAYNNSPYHSTMRSEYRIILSDQTIEKLTDETHNNSEESINFTDAHQCFINKVLNDNSILVLSKIFDDTTIDKNIKVPLSANINYGSYFNFTDSKDAERLKLLFINEDSYYHEIRQKHDYGISWKDINYNNEIPVLLGHDYADHLRLNDQFILKSNVLTSELKVKVVGFLEPDTRVYYDGIPSMNLDSHILVPIPDLSERDKFKNEVDFKNVSSSLFNSLLISKRNISDESMREYLKPVASECDLKEYTVGSYEWYHTAWFEQYLQFKKYYLISYTILAFISLLSLSILLFGSTLAKKYV